MSVKRKVKELEDKREKFNREIDAELAKLMVLCDHKNKKSYPYRPGEEGTECLDCGKWW